MQSRNSSWGNGDLPVLDKCFHRQRGRLDQSRLSSVARGGVLLIPIFIVLFLAGCAGSSGPGCLDIEIDSLVVTENAVSLELFEALPAEEQAHRRQKGLDFLAQADRSSRLKPKLALLMKAVAMDPELCEGWLDLADILREVGEDARTEEALNRCQDAIRKLDSRGGNNLTEGQGTRLALLWAWFRYDRGEWSKGLRWAKKALREDSGNAAANLIGGLLEARLGNAAQARGIADDMLRLDDFATPPAWIHAGLESSRGLDREAFSFLIDLRPQGPHVAECYQDMGSTAERLEEWSYAERWYREAASAIPFNKTGCLKKVSHARLAAGSGAATLPVWLGIEGAFVVGSWSAYTALALDKFSRATPGPLRDRWAGAVVNGAGICLRLNLDRPWARRAKGLVFAATGHPKRAVADLRRTSKELAAVGAPDALVESELGRLLILVDGFDEALVHLKKAVALAPQGARAWSDLGLVLVRSGDRAGADQALSRALELDPGLAAAWYNRGLLNMHKGDLDRAASDLGMAAKLAPDNQEIARLLQRVELALKQQ